ncbi:MAG: hypothetical protein NC335_09605 [Bacteroides sp.]|nr:hypothetical protein [Bacteroides sp.]
MRKRIILSAAVLTLLLPAACEKPQGNGKDDWKMSSVTAILPDDLEEFDLDYEKPGKSLEFLWECEDTDAEYAIVFSLSEELDEPVCIDVEDGLSAKVTHKEFDGILADLGVGEYRMGELFWAIRATKSGKDSYSYSEVRSMKLFRFYSPFIDPRDGEEYGVCRVSDAMTGDYSVWMRANMRAVKYSDGTEIGDGVKFYTPKEGEDESIAKVYGGYYRWTAAVRGNHGAEEGEKLQGVCPDGWHVPTKAEWDFLINACTSDDNPAGSLKNKAYWDPASTNGNKPVTNILGFDMAATGYIWEVPANDVIENGANTYFWTATEPREGDVYPWNPDPADFPSQGVTYGFTKDDFGAALYPYDRSRGYSVRCVLD